MTRLMLILATLILAAPALALAGKPVAPKNTTPWQTPQYWPYAIGDQAPNLSDHFVIHYTDAGDLAMAVEVLGHLEGAWHDQIMVNHALPPLSDNGIAPPNGKLDVYLWRGIDTLYVDSVTDNPSTWWDDAATYIVLDPWGQYGATFEERRANIYHEFRHASHQAATDWWEDFPIFEADATFWEARRYGFARLPFAWADFQARPDWSPFRDDAFRTWSMYGGALYFDYVSRRYFNNGLGFTNEMWLLSVNPPGAEFDPSKNEPDFVDALGQLLSEKGTTFFDSIVGFTRARWYTGSRAAGQNFFTDGAVLAEVTPRIHTRGGGSPKSSVRIDAQMLGSAFITVVRGAADPAELNVSFKAGGQGTARSVVQTVGNGSADAVLNLDAGPARLRFGANGRATIAVTVLPGPGMTYDPDLADDTQFSTELVFDRP